MVSQQQYDAIIIGSGQGGGPLASALARAGSRVAIIEREHVGGTCINEGCTPTKTMVASARVAYLARRGGDYGVHGDVPAGCGGLSASQASSLSSCVAMNVEIVMQSPSV